MTHDEERDVLRYELRPALIRLKLYFKGFGWHQFRRNYISLMQTVGGATAFEVQKDAGHANLGNTYQYTLRDGDRETEQLTAFYDWAMGPAGGLKQ